MTYLKEQAVKMLQNIPDEKMTYIINIMKSLNDDNAIDDSQNDNSLSFDVLRANSEALEAWKGFREYKGIIAYEIDEKAELAKARDEKYADFNRYQRNNGLYSQT